MCVSLCLYACVCAYVCMCLCLSVYVSVCLCVCLCVPVSVCVSVCACVSVCVCVCLGVCVEGVIWLQNPDISCLMNRRQVLAWKLWERSRKATMVQAWRWSFPVSWCRAAPVSLGHGSERDPGERSICRKGWGHASVGCRWISHCDHVTEGFLFIPEVCLVCVEV